MDGRPRAGAAGTSAATEALRTAIANGDLVPGQRLVEVELADAFSVSRASLRAALVQLADQGLVERIPNRGARVRTVSVAEAISITECRMVLEGLCARKAAEAAEDADRDRLSEIGEQMRRAVSDGDPMKYSQLNRELHRIVREASGQMVAADLLDRLNGQLVRHQFRLALRPGRSTVSLAEHLAIIDAIVAGKPQQAERAARAHLKSVIDALGQGDK